MLTKQENKVLNLVCGACYSDKEAADVLHVSTRTVVNHKQNIFHKLGFKRTINTIAKRKSVLIQALGDLGEVPGAVSKKSKRHFSNQELLKIKASITKKAPARA